MFQFHNIVIRLNLYLPRLYTSLGSIVLYTYYMTAYRNDHQAAINNAHIGLSYLYKAIGANRVSII